MKNSETPFNITITDFYSQLLSPKTSVIRVYISKCFEKSLPIGIITINRIAKLNKTVGKKITGEIIELNCSQLKINQFKRSYFLLCLVAVRWRKVNKWPVCFEAKGNRFGRFYVPRGRLAAIKLVHLYGYVSCHVHGPSFWSYWGCGDNVVRRKM